MRRILLALGANRAGAWGPPAETLGRTLMELGRAGIRPAVVSHLYETAAMGAPSRTTYRNAVLSAWTSLAPVRLLQTVKRLEVMAGRRTTHRWGPRVLDIDVLDDPACRLGWWRRASPTAVTGRLIAQRQQHSLDAHKPDVRQGLVIPHPQLHRRAFVLVPLLDVAPHWRHPVTGRAARALLARLPRQRHDVRLAPEAWPRAGFHAKNTTLTFPKSC